MKTILIFAAVMSLCASVAMAEGNATYSCVAKANPDRGFPMDSQLVVTADGQLMIKTSQGSKSLGAAKVLTVKLSQEGGKQIIGAILQYVGSEELSGLRNPAVVDSFQKYYIETDDGEIAVYRFFAGEKQVGGTFWLDEHATRCLP